MTNLTITIDDELLKKARIRALEQGTSVNALLRDYLRAYAGESGHRIAMKELIEHARRSTSGSGKKGRHWTRDELYG